MPSGHDASTYQIKISLDDVHPPVWRRVAVPGSTTLSKLHRVMQVVMGWEDAHLHQFTVAGKRCGDAEQDEFGELGFTDETRDRLRDLFPEPGHRFEYEYDFGDSWHHTLVIEGILPLEDGVRRPTCLAGARACPPEDVGGPAGYEAYLDALRDPGHAEHDEWLAWRGEFDPEAFRLEKINAELKRPGRSTRGAAHEDWWVDDQPLPPIPAPPAGWVERLTPDLVAAAESLSLRRDLLAFLAYLRDFRVTGTQATGNLPLKAAREIASRFVDPPRFGITIGDRSYPLRSAQEVWPLDFVHVLASVGGLASGGRGRQWRLTPEGEEFVQAAPSMQLRFLLATWWTRVNWLLGVPYGLAGDALPPGFEDLTLRTLLSLPAEDTVAFEQFADRLVSTSGLADPSQQDELAVDLLRTAVERMVLRPLSDFGEVTLERRPLVLAGGVTLQRVHAFRVSRVGRVLLEALQA